MTDIRTSKWIPAKAAIVLAFSLFLAVFALAVPQQAHAAKYPNTPSGYIGECSWSIDTVGTLTIAPAPGYEGAIYSDGYWDWSAHANLIKEVVFEKGVKAKDPEHPNHAILMNMFKGCKNLTKVDLSDFDTSEASNMESMFEGCIFLKELDLSKLNTSNVIIMSRMFANCDTLATLDISSLDTSSVEDGEDMFLNCDYLETIKIGSKFTLFSELPEGTWVQESTGKKYPVTTEGVSGEGKPGAGSYTRVPAGGSNAGNGSTDPIQTADDKPSAKKANKITKAVTSKTYKRSAVKAKARSFKIAAKAKGGAKVTYKLYKRLKTGKITAKKVKRWIIVNASGKVTVKKGAPRGTYRLKVKINAKATKAYKKTTVTKTITIKVK